MVLDTCFCVDLIRETAQKKEGPARTALLGLGNAFVYISLFTLCELRTGAEMSQQPQEEHKKIDSMTSFLQVLYPNNDFSRLYSESVALLGNTAGHDNPIPTMDLLIAVTAKSAGLPLLTRDPTHYEGIQDLQVKGY